MAVSPDGTRVYVTNRGGNNVTVIDTTNNSVVTTVPVGLEPLGVAVNPAGTRDERKIDAALEFDTTSAGGASFKDFTFNLADSDEQGA